MEYVQKMRERKKIILECITIGIALGLYVFVIKVMGVGCPIKYFTGVSCAGCGMTRAWAELLHMNIKEAFYYHPLFGVPIVCLIAFIWKDKISEKKYKLLWWSVVVIAMCVYIFRLIDTSDTVVVFEPQEGKLVEIGKWFLKIINNKKGITYEMCKMWM